MGVDGLDVLHDIFIKIVIVVRKHIVKLPGFFSALGVLDIEVHMKIRGGLDYNLQHIEVHLIIPLVVSLVTPLMVQFRFVRDDQGAKMEVGFVEKEFDDFAVKIDLCRAYLCPLYFKSMLEPVPLFDRSH